MINEVCRCCRVDAETQTMTFWRSTKTLVILLCSISCNVNVFLRLWSKR